MTTDDPNFNEGTVLPGLRGLVLSSCEGIEWSAISLLAGHYLRSQLAGLALMRSSVSLKLAI